MNILPFIITMILVLSMLSFSQLRHIRSTEIKAFSAYFKDFKQLRNEKIPKVSKKCSDPKHCEKKNDTDKIESCDEEMKGYLRDTYLGCKEGRLYLRALIEKPHETALLKEVANAYFSSFYSHLEGYDPSLFNEIIEKYIQHFNLHNEYAPLHILSFQPPKKQLNYRILRGTNFYSFNPRKGFPPFEAFFSFEANDAKKPMQFNAAPRIFLETLFSKEFTSAFCLEEFARQKAKKPFTKEEMVEKIRALAAEKMISGVEEKIGFFDFSKPLPKKQSVIEDKKTHITLREHHFSENLN